MPRTFSVSSELFRSFLNVLFLCNAEDYISRPSELHFVVKWMHKDLVPALTGLCFLVCDCRGEAALSWSLPETARKESKRLSITESVCGRNDRQLCSTLTLNMAQANHTGFYSCKYLSTPATKKKKTEATVYVFIHGKISIFCILFVIALE